MMKDQKELKEEFVRWCLTIPDFDETLVYKRNQNMDGFTNETISALYTGFCAGFKNGYYSRD